MAFVTIKDKDNATLGHLQTDAQERLGVHNLLHVEDVKASDIHGGTFTSGAWRTRDLNTVWLNNIAGAALASNQITLPAGTYFIDASLPSREVNAVKSRLYNITGAVSVLDGSGENSYATAYVQSRSNISGVFTLSLTSVLELQMACATTRADLGFGTRVSAIGLGDIGASIYTTCKIWRIA